MNELIFLVEEAPEGGFTARALAESIFTEADSIEELRTAVQDAVGCHFDPGSRSKADPPPRSAARVARAGAEAGRLAEMIALHTGHQPLGLIGLVAA